MPCNESQQFENDTPWSTQQQVDLECGIQDATAEDEWRKKKGMKPLMDEPAAKAFALWFSGEEAA